MSDELTLINKQKYNATLLLSLILAASFMLSACGDKSTAKADVSKNKPQSTLVTVTTVKTQAIEITEETVGSLEGLVDPTIAAEVAAKIIKVHVRPGATVTQGQLIATLDAGEFGMQRNEAQSEVARIEAQLDNQAKVVARSQALVDKKFISQNALDTDKAQLKVLNQQLVGAKARVGSVNYASSKTSIYAPVSGVVEKKLVDTGDYVRVGDPIVQIISRQRLLAHLPFPESIAAKLKPGLKVRLTTPTTQEPVISSINELKPQITMGNRTVDVIANVNDVAGWQPGASVTGVVILSEEPAAMMVPEQSVVLRPAGEVVYVVRDNVAYQAIVKTGLRKDGLIEIKAGLQDADTIVVDGAGFLTDKAAVKRTE